MTKQTIAQVHPVAQLFPMLDRGELAELAESIRQNGLLTPIRIDPNGVLLDGRNRLRACEMAGVEPRFEVYNGDDPVEFILAANIDRRHLTAGQCALIIALVYPDPEQCGRGRPSQLSKLEGYSASRLSEARKIVRHSRDLALEVIAGLTPFAQALQYAEYPVEDEYVEPLPDPGDPVAIGTTSRSHAAYLRRKVAATANKSSAEEGQIEYPETLAARIVAVDRISPGYAQRVIDLIVLKLGPPPTALN
jgi:hypothetical protein